MHQVMHIPAGEDTMDAVLEDLLSLTREDILVWLEYYQYGYLKENCIPCQNSIQWIL